MAARVQRARRWATFALALASLASVPVSLRAAGVESERTPAAPHRFRGDARISYSSSAVHPEVGDSTGKEVEIKVDVAFGKSRGLPSGVVYIDFRGADMVLVASQLQWLVVTDKQIELKGPCFLDDSDGFTFQMKIERPSDEAKPRLRIKVWETENPAHVIFDNQRDDKWSAPISAHGELLSGELGVS